MISEGNKNYSNLQAPKLLIGNVMEALHNNDTSRAVLYLNLTGQQLSGQILGNQTTGITSPIAMANVTLHKHSQKKHILSGNRS
jgi:hypothetical protein